jgi:flagellar basal body rod protein FlgG
MAGFVDIASGILASAQRRLDVIAVNVSNINTPGFRTRKVFQQVLDARQAMPTISTIQPNMAGDFVLKATGNPLDIAVTGSGYMLLRADDRLFPVVSAQLRRDGEGRLVDPAGRVLQASGGGDVVVSGNKPVLLKDGTIVINGQAEARIGAFVGSVAAGDTSGLPLEGALPEEAAGVVLQQGMIVPSNVDLGAEMVEMTRAARMAETGSRVFQVYDDLLGRVASKMGEVAR